ncbi:MAG: hydrogenase nickel incorporation protein HypB [Gammaproteobacteria bacterium]
MCNTCGCNITPGNRHLLQPAAKPAGHNTGQSAITILKSLLTENDHQAMHNRQHLDGHGILAINLMSSPGSGKTALLEQTLAALKNEYRIAVIEGDLETENDAVRIRAQGVPCVQISTGSACHLDAHMVHDALHQLELNSLDLLFIENVGNLVCPASFDLGHHRNLTLLSVTEGDDKPAKYPVMFRGTDLMLLSKTDLLPMLDDFVPERAEQYLRKLANPSPVLSLSAKTGSGMQAWFDWLHHEVEAHQQRLAEQQTLIPRMQPDGVRLHSEGR